MAFNIADLFEHAVDAVPSRTAVVANGERRSYQELEDRANQLAHYLARHNVGAGSHVGIYARNRVEFVESMLGLFKLRAVPVNVNYHYVEDELAYVFENADLVGLVHERRYSPLVERVLSRTPDIKDVLVLADQSDETPSHGRGVPYEEALASSGTDRSFEPRSDDDVYILYTGGTTGMPKGVMWRHEDVFRTLGGGIDFRTGERVPTDVTLANRAMESEPVVSFPLAPLMHGAAQWGTLSSLFRGNKVVLIDKFEPHKVWSVVEREQVNRMTITGDAMARPLVEALQEGHYEVSWLRAISSTAAVFSPSVKAQFLELLPDVVVTDSVGASETGFSGMSVVGEGGRSRGGPTVEMGPDTIVIDENGRPIEPGSGKIGWMARGGNIPLGYYKDPKKTAETFTDIDGKRYAIPGDFARVEADGRMTLLGRGSTSINTGGEKVFPEEVEGALKSHPDVFDCLVVGIPDARWGEKITALVQSRTGGGPSLEELQRHSRGKIAGYKVPRELIVLDELKRHPSGKPDYAWARERALEVLENG